MSAVESGLFTRLKLDALGHEGFRLFFVLAAVHAALWPFLWVALHALELPLAENTPSTIWHAHEMIVGSFGAALIGFITTAVPEWTDTPVLRYRPLFIFAGLWAVPRLVGALGADLFILPAGLLDLGWILLLLVYVLHRSWLRRTDRLTAFVFWLSLLAIAEGVARWGMFTVDYDLMELGTYGTGYAFLGLLGIALGRVNVQVTNLVLDPTEESSPFRPHPGRMDLAAGLVFVGMLGEVFGLSDPVQGFLWFAAGAGFVDRVGEAFIGRAFWRVEILTLAGSALLAGAGLMLYAASLIGAPFGTAPGLHLAFMGGLGLGVFAVFTIAGLIHSGHNLPFPKAMHLSFTLMLASVAIRVLRVPYLAASLLWAAGSFTWLAIFWKYLTDRGSLGAHAC